MTVRMVSSSPPPDGCGGTESITDPLVVAILTFFDGVGHVVRSCKVGAELAARGHNVVVGCAERAKQMSSASTSPTGRYTKSHRYRPKGIHPDAAG